MWVLKARITLSFRWGFKVTVALLFGLLYHQSVNAQQAARYDIANHLDIIENRETAKFDFSSIATNYSSCSITDIIVSSIPNIHFDDCIFQALEAIDREYCAAQFASKSVFKKVLTRHEFAVNLNNCINYINELLLSEQVVISQNDLEIIETLKLKFSSELEELRQQTEKLNNRIRNLENNQFSTTATLSGTAIFSGLNYFSGEGDNQFVLQQQTYLNISASFTGRDNLALGIVGSNADIPDLASTNKGKDVGSTREGLTTLEYGGSTDNNVALATLEYTFPIVDAQDEQLYLSLAFLDGFNTSRFLPAVGYITQQGQEIGSGAVSAFGQQNPIFRLNSGAGIIAQYDSDFVGFTAAYLASQASDPSEGNGFFNGDYLALAQLNLTPSAEFALGLTYQHNYFGPGRFAYSNQIESADTPGFVGTALANRFDNSGVFFDENIAVTSNSYGVQAIWEISSLLTIGGFVAKTDARLLGKGDADVLSYGIVLNFPDLGQEGNQGGLVIGVEPTLTNINAAGVSNEDFKSDTSLHIEAFYQHRLTDNISITPGVIWISAPNQDANNQDIVEGVIRTTFSF